VIGTFRPDFYVAVAAAIPVLLITTSLQTTYFSELSRWLTEKFGEEGRATRVVPFVVKWSAGILFFAAGLAELLALRSLWFGADFLGWFQFLTITVLLFPILVGLTIMVRLALDIKSGDSGSDDKSKVD